MSKIKKIIVGLPARNEESAITKCLESVRESILYSGRSNTTLVVCLNGCTDKTPALVETFQERYQDIRCEVIQSNEGLVNAQREIVKKYPADVYVFSDSDSTIDQRSIELLLSNLEKHSEVVVAYAKTAPLEKLDNKTMDFVSISYNEILEIINIKTKEEKYSKCKEIYSRYNHQMEEDKTELSKEEQSKLENIFFNP